LRDQPSPELTRLLAHLRLAGPAELRAAARRAVRLARGVPLFDTVWIDALVQTGALSLFQARRLHAGRGAQLARGPFVLVERIHSLGPIETYRAFERETRRPVRLIVAERPDPADGLEARLANLVERSKRVASVHVAPVRFAALIDASVLVACDWVDGPSIESLVVRQGRFSADAVARFATQIIDGLKALEIAGLVHGDLHPRDLILHGSGRLVLAAPATRPALRPTEGYAFAELDPAAYAALAPERVRDGTPPTRAADVYALGIVCWHLLSGRAPYPLANSLATLRAIERGRIPDISQVAVNVPATFAAMISACTDRDPLRRPAQYDTLLSLLGVVPNVPHSLPHSAAPAACTTRRAWPVRAAFAAACSLLALAIGGTLKLRPPHPPAPTAAARESPIAVTPPTLLKPETSADLAATAPPENLVLQATYTAPASRPADLVLPGDRPLYLESISPLPGQVVRGPEGQRAQVWLTRGPLALGVDDLRFENVDFMWHSTAAHSPDSPSAMFTLTSNRVRFVQCSFRTVGDLTSAPTVVATAPRTGSTDPLRLPTIVCDFENCVAFQVESMVAHQRPVALVARLSNVLVLRSRGVVRIDEPPPRDAPLTVNIRSCTFREIDWCLTLPATLLPSPGRIAVHSDHSVFALTTTGGLLQVRGEDGWRWLAETDWRGQGSMLDPAARLLCWPDRGTVSGLENRLAVTGLVRSELEFSGDTTPDVTTSELVRWSAPLLSSEAPGAAVSHLSLGRN
jgi:serine/threonine-protein kinase